MLKEIIQNQKSRALIIVFVILLFIVVIIFCVSHKRDGNDDSNLNILDTENMSIITGVWKVTEYLGESVENHGAEATTETELSENDTIIKKIKDKYLNKELYINNESIITFSPPTELGYQIMNWEDLFSIYRQPSDIWDGISPPFFCVSFNLKDYDEAFDLIIDTNNNATLVVNGLFFRLEKTATD